jgi:hypothetical protein
VTLEKFPRVGNVSRKNIGNIIRAAENFSKKSFLERSFLAKNIFQEIFWD